MVDWHTGHHGSGKECITLDSETLGSNNVNGKIMIWPTTALSCTITCRKPPPPKKSLSIKNLYHNWCQIHTNFVIKTTYCLITEVEIYWIWLFLTFKNCFLSWGLLTIRVVLKWSFTVNRSELESRIFWLKELVSNVCNWWIVCPIYKSFLFSCDWSLRQLSDGDIQ